MSERRAIEELAALFDGDLLVADADAANQRLASLAAAIGEHTVLPEPGRQFRMALRTQLVQQPTDSPISPMVRRRCRPLLSLRLAK